MRRTWATAPGGAVRECVRQGPGSSRRRGSTRTCSRRQTPLRRFAVGLFFFIARPGMLPAVLQYPQVILACRTAGALPRDPVALQPAPHRGLRVPNAPVRLGDLEDLWDGLKIGREPVRRGPSCELAGERRQRLSGDRGGPAVARHRSEGLRPSLLESELPLVHGHRRYLQLTSHLRLGDP